MTRSSTSVSSTSTISTSQRLVGVLNLNPEPQAKPQALNLKPYTLYPTPYTQTLTPKHEALNPGP